MKGLKTIEFQKLFIGLSSVCLVPGLCSAQSEWSEPVLEYKKIVIPSKFLNEDVVIISDKLFLDLKGYSKKTLKRDVLLKINTKEGLNKFGSVTLPESFDRGWNQELWQQGRNSRLDIPYIQDFDVRSFDARIISQNNTIQDASPILRYHKARWIKETGEYANDEVPTYSFENLKVGDLVEYKYEMDYRPKYGSDMFYLASEFPKLKLECTIEYLVLPKLSNYNFILTPNIPDSCRITSRSSESKGMVYLIDKVKLDNVDKVNYPIHAMSSAKLPYAYFNMNYTIRLFNNRSYAFANLPDYRWATDPQPNSAEFDWYTKYPNDIRRFVNSFPKFENDSLNVQFLKALNDTLNSFRYYSTNYLFYHEPRLYSEFSSEHLFKRRLVEMNMLHIYKSILNNKGVFYYLANIQDKRLGENNPLIRNRSYENIILAVPYKSTYVYIVPRFNGLSYFLNEIPFYYQGAVAALFPINYVKLPGDTMGNHFRFIKTYAGTCDDNIRIESCKVRINPDSSIHYVTGKVSLLGQFSTILRSYYQGKVIDSTINESYFRKFLSKSAIDQPVYTVKSKSELYPFKHEFNGVGTIHDAKAGEINLENWFSFLLSSRLVFERPSHDYYFDFPFSDIYTIDLEFSEKVTISDLKSYNKTIRNNYFELNSLITSSDKSFHWNVIVKVKKLVIPNSDGELLMSFVKALDDLNSIVMHYYK